MSYDMITLIAAGYFAGKPNVNSIIFDHDEYLTSLKTAIDIGLPVGIDKPNPIGDMDENSICGLVKSFTFEDNTLYLHVKPVDKTPNPLVDLVLGGDNVAYGALVGDKSPCSKDSRIMKSENIRHKSYYMSGTLIPANDKATSMFNTLLGDELYNIAYSACVSVEKCSDDGDAKFVFTDDSSLVFNIVDKSCYGIG
jgi:hypothetical protein